MTESGTITVRDTGKRVTIPVAGMTCAACSGRVQRALETAEGVGSANVNLMTQNATILFDPQRTSPEALVDTIRRTGYEAELVTDDRSAFEEQEAQDRAQAAEFRSLGIRALVSLAAAALGMILSMPVMAAPAGDGGHAAVADPFMRWNMRVIDPWRQQVAPWLYAVDPRVWLYTLLVMTVGVMAWAGRHFYTRAWAAFRHRSADMNTLVAVGTGAAFIYSLVATVAPQLFLSRGLMPDVYYEAILFIIALILLGNTLEARAK